MKAHAEYHFDRMVEINVQKMENNQRQITVTLSYDYDFYIVDKMVFSANYNEESNTYTYNYRTAKCASFTGLQNIEHFLGTDDLQTNYS